MKSKVIRTDGSAAAFQYADKPDSTTLLNTFDADTPDAIASEVLELRKYAPDLRNPVEHLILAFPVGESPGEEKLLDVVTEYVQRMGLDQSKFPMKIELHRDKGSEELPKLDIHIHASRISADGSEVWGNQNSAKRSIKIAAELEMEFGLQRSPEPNPERKRTPTPEEVGMSERLGEALPRAILADHIDRAITASQADGSGLSGMIKRLNNNRVSVQLNTTKNGEIRGISFELRGWGGKQSPRVTGSSIGRQYSYSNIKRRLSDDPKLILDHTQQATHIPQPILTESAPDPSPHLCTDGDLANSTAAPTTTVEDVMESTEDMETAYARALRAAARAQRAADRIAQRSVGDQAGQAARDDVARHVRLRRPRL